MYKEYSNVSKNLLTLPKKIGKLVPMGNLQVILSDKKLPIADGDYLYLSSDNLIYALVKFLVPETVSKDLISKKMIHYKMTSKEFEQLSQDEYTSYPFEVVEYYPNPKYVIYDRVKYPDDYTIISDYKLPLEKSSVNYSEEYSNDRVKFTLNKDNLEQSVDLISFYFNSLIDKHDEFDFSLSIVPKVIEPISFETYSDDYVCNGRSNVFSLPFGLKTKLIKNGGIVKIFSDTLGEISDLVPNVKKEAERLPYNVLKADCFLYSDNLSSTTIKNILKNNIKLDTAELILFDSEFADIDLTEETPINRWKYLKSCVLGGHKISLVGSSMASNQEFVNELYDNSSMGIAIIEGNYDTGKKILKVKGSEIELSVDDVQFDGKNYKIYTKLGILNSLKPVTLSSNIVSYVGETVFILLDSGYCESNRE